MTQISFKNLISTYPEIVQQLGHEQFGEINGLDLINYEFSHDDFNNKLRNCCVAELRDITAFLNKRILVDDVDYAGVKEFITEFGINNNSKKEFILNTDENMDKFRTASVLGRIAEKVIENEHAFLKKICTKVFDNSTMLIIAKVGEDLKISKEQLQSEFTKTTIEYFTHSNKFKMPIVTDIITKYKNNDPELDKTLIDSIYPS